MQQAAELRDELEAIGTVVRALETLPDKSRARVLRYIVDRFKLGRSLKPVP